jgi:hypothetical protein
MTPDASAAALNEALSKLETALLTPVVSGELGSWAAAVEKAFRGLSQSLLPFLESVLHPQYAEIARTDSELLPRVQQLIADDRQVLAEQATFGARLSDFVRRAGQIKKHESRVAAEREQLEQEGISLILKIRKQRAAADTWLGEALYRDRGPVD